MAWPPAIFLVKVPETCSSVAFEPRSATAAFTLASFAPVTVLSTVTSTLFVAGSMPYDVPGSLTDSSSVATAEVSCAVEFFTTVAVAPAASAFFSAASWSPRP